MAVVGAGIGHRLGTVRGSKDFPRAAALNASYPATIDCPNKNIPVCSHTTTFSASSGFSAPYITVAAIGP